MSSVACQLQPVPFTKVVLDDCFWAPRLETNRKVTIPHNYQMCETTGRFSAFDLNFKRAVPSPIVLIFGDSDAAKWVEAASFSLTTHPDPVLESQLDQVTERIIRAQQPDGYLNTHFITVQPEMKWKNLRDWHEMYCAGHLIESAVAHYQATGNSKLLDTLCRYADHIDSIFGAEPGKKRGYPGHPELELALVKLYHATNNPSYLKLATYMVDERGTQPHYYDIEARERGDDPAKFWFKNYEYCQAHLPVREQTKVVGHAVRAMYLLSAMADLAHENNDPSLLETCERLWENLVTRRMYLTGGIGPAKHNEGFTEDYDLPDEAYAETCATIGLVQWNHRLLQFSGESKYADVIERGLYNGFISSISLEGNAYFYENPLSSNGTHHRQEWFDCPCCPPNVARTLASLGGFFYSTGADSVWVHLFAQGTADLNVGGQSVQLRQITNFPWSGDVKFEVGLSARQRFGLHLRVPAWCKSWALRVNGVPVANQQPQPNGYLLIEREWHAGDVIEYAMDMRVQVVWAHPAVRYLQGRMAIQRGPLVYCLEGVDHDNIALDQISLDPARVLSEAFSVEFCPDLLGGVSVLRGKGLAVDQDQWQEGLYGSQAPATREIEITAIPYYVWDHRAAGEMRVWFRAKA